MEEDMTSNASRAAEAFFIGKRNDGKGWDVIVQGAEKWETFGPYRRRRDAQIDLLNGTYREGHGAPNADTT